MDVTRSGLIGSASITLEISHANPVDLRIWLHLQDGRKFLVADREERPTLFRIDVDLMALGLTQEDFANEIFTFEIINYSETNSGELRILNIDLIYYQLPLGFEFHGIVPKRTSDGTVLYFITLTDNTKHSMNTTIFSYYSDGIAPNIELADLLSPLDVSGS